MIKTIILLLGLNAIDANNPDEIEKAIQAGDLKVLQLLTSKPITIDKSSKEKYLNIASEIASKAKANLDSTSNSYKMNLKQFARLLSGLTVSFIGLNQLAQLAKGQDWLDDQGIRVTDEQALYLYATGGIISIFGINQVYKGITNFDRKQEYFKALAIEALVKSIPTN